MKLTGRFVWIGVLVVLGLVILIPDAQAGWVNKTPMKCSRGYAGVAVVDNQLFVAGGKRVVGVSPIVTSRLEVYYPWSNTWAYCANMPTKVWGAAAAGLNSKLYIAGGYTNFTGTKTNKLQIYNPGTNTWTQGPVITGLNAGATGIASSAAAVLNGKIYVLDEDATNKKKLYIFDPTAAGGVGAWTTDTDLVSDFYPGCTMQAIDGKLYVVGGTLAPVDKVSVYDPAGGGTWTDVTPSTSMTTRYDLASAVVDNKLFAIGGWDGTNCSAKVEAYDKAATVNKWLAKPDLPLGSNPAITYNRRGLGAGAINGTIYVVGGQDSVYPDGPTSAYSKNLQAFVPAEQVIVSILAPYTSGKVGNQGQDWMVVLRLLYLNSNLGDSWLPAAGANKYIPGMVLLIPTAEAPGPLGKNWGHSDAAKPFNHVALNYVGNNQVEVLATWYVANTTNLGPGFEATVYATVVDGTADATITDDGDDGRFDDELNALMRNSNVAKVDFYINPLDDFLMKQK